MLICTNIFGCDESQSFNEPLLSFFKRVAERVGSALFHNRASKELGRPSRWKDGLTRSFMHRSTHHFS